MSVRNQKCLEVLGQINLDDLHIEQAFSHYSQRYRESKLAQQFVAHRCLIADEHHNGCMVGFCDRTLGKNIPKSKSVDGAAIRGSLQRCGIVRATGHELFRGCIVFPSSDSSGNITSAVGYRIGRIREGDKAVVYWHKPESASFVDVGMTFAQELIREQACH
jgi:hypothetical protein